LVSATMEAELVDYCGAAVTCRRTGRRAIEAMKSRRFDAALIDALLPDMNGFELIQQAACLNIPALLTTGHPDAISICQHYSMPYLEKPFLPATLAERTIDLVREHQQNVALVLASSDRLKKTIGDLRRVMAESRRLIEETMQLRERNLRVRHRPLGSAPPDANGESA
jgi:DNA-binding response OmpR family regulator